MLLVVTYSQMAWTTLRNTCQTRDEVVVHQLGRVVLFDETELAVFFAPRPREKYDEDVQIEQTQSLSESVVTPDTVREAVAAYEDRESPATPHSRLTSETDYPSAIEMQCRGL